VVIVDRQPLDVVFTEPTPAPANEPTWHYDKISLRRHPLLWLRRVLFGPIESREARIFERDWNEADEAGRRRLRERYQEQYHSRLDSLRTVATDSATLGGHFGLLVVVAGIVLQPKIDAFLHTPARYSIWLVAAAWFFLSKSHIPRVLYSLFTHFLGVAEWVHIEAKPLPEQIDKEDVDRLRRSVNHLSRTLQRARRYLVLAWLTIFVLVLAVCIYVSQL
jgi:hypothetical protein